MLQIFSNHPYILGGILYLLASVLAVCFVYACSVVNGNHMDPYRDVGNGGCSEEDSFKQFEIDTGVRLLKANEAHAM